MKEFKEYTRKTIKDIIILALFAIVFGVAAYVFYTKHSYILSIAMALGSLILFIGATTSYFKDNQFFEDIENSPNKDEILNDFKQSIPYADDGIRMGNKYIFTKKLTSLISYEDIIRLQYFEHMDADTALTEYGIYVELANGISRTLCDIYGYNPRIQAQEIMNAILYKNHNVEVKM